MGEAGPVALEEAFHLAVGIQVLGSEDRAFVGNIDPDRRHFNEFSFHKEAPRVTRYAGAVDDVCPQVKGW